MGGILGGLFGGGGQEQQMQGLRASRADIQALRPEAMQARLNALRAMTSGYQGANNALETLWGAPPSTAPRDDFATGRHNRMMGHDLPRPAPQQASPQQLPPQPGPQAQLPQGSDLEMGFMSQLGRPGR